MTRRSFILALAGLALVAGCAKPLEPVFPPPAKPILWPPPPEPTRVRYVGQLVTSADLKPRIGLGERIGAALFGKKPAFSMLSPYAVCTDGKSRVFVADSNAQLVHVFDVNTRKYERWVPNNAEKRFAQPVGVAYDPAGRLIVSDSVGQRLYIFDAKGRQVAEYTLPLLARPAGIAFDVTRQRIYVADPASHQIFILSPQGAFQARMGGRGTQLGQFNFPTNVAVDSQGRVYVSDSLNFRIQQFAPDFRPIRQIGRKGDMPGYFGQPKGLAVDSQDHLYVVDAHFETVQIFDANGNLLLDFGVEGHGAGEFWLPAGIYIDKNNRIWVADTYNRRVQVFDYVPEVRR
jgi:DNA-binding beta-propeller fold protein YncE